MCRHFLLCLLIASAMGEWHASTRTQIGGDGDGGYSQIAASPDGERLWISFQSYATSVHSLVIESCDASGQNCMRSLVDQGPSDREVGRFQHMRLGTDGLPVMCYSAQPEMRFARCHDANCSSISIEVIDANASEANSTSAPDGKLLRRPNAKCSIADESHVVFTKFGKLTLAVRRLSEWHLYTIAPGNVDHVSVQLLPSSQNASIAVSYQENTSDGKRILNIARCDLPCENGGAVQTWDARGDTGHYSSLAVLGNSLVVHYIDKASGTLRSADDISGSVVVRTLDTVGGPGACPGMPSCPYGAFLTSRTFAEDVWVSYFDESDGASSVGRVKVRNGANGVLWYDQGPDGWGRDTCLTMVRNSEIAVSYMAYASDTTQKRSRLAVLREDTFVLV